MTTISRIAVSIVALSLPVLSARAAGDATRGKAVFSQCAACHTITADGKDGLGPNLVGIVGRKAGSKPGYAYSDGMKAAGFSWTADHLDAFLKNPAAVVPDSNMFFMGIANDGQRADLIAYLSTLK